MIQGGKGSSAGLCSWSYHVHNPARVLQTGLNDLGIRLKCVDKKQIRLPTDLSDAAFRVGSGEYADDMALVDTSPTSLSLAL
jgi:hypothetical protein